MNVTKITQVMSLANSLLEEHGLKEQGWRFELSNHKTLVGQCVYSTKTIHYSMWFLSKSTDRDIKDTILHEIAHALTRIRYGRGDHVKSHGWQWRQMCIEIGARPQRLAGEEAVTSATKYNYKIVCDECGRSWKRYRLRSGYLNGYFKSSCCSASMSVYELEEVND